MQNWFGVALPESRLYKMTTKKIILSGDLKNRNYKFVDITYHKWKEAGGLAPQEPEI